MKQALRFALIGWMTVVALCLTVWADDLLLTTDNDTIAVCDYDDLRLLEENPNGSYILMNDIDFTGKEWKPFTFYGTLDGNGHSFLNLSVQQVSLEERTTYDGNYKQYDTVFAGVFGILENATVKNLNVYGLKVDITLEQDCFIGGIAGYADHATIENCTVSGTLQQKITGKMFGVGGIVGFGGEGDIRNCKADVTLICVDNDAENKDEQFMGGGYGAGYLNVEDTEVHLQGYISDHGYVHSGGMVGMYAIWPKGTKYPGKINRNNVVGQITFFEDNKDRRAYCSAYCGEVMQWTYEFAKNKESFKRNEVFEYSKDLYPHSNCDGTMTEETVINETCVAFGSYVRSTCSKCGYETVDRYTLPEHTVSQWSVTKEATTEAEGRKTGICDQCGAEVMQKTAKIEPEPEPPAEDEPAEKKPSKAWVLVLVGVAAVLLVFVLWKKKKAEEERKRRRAARKQRNDRERAQRERHS